MTTYRGRHVGSYFWLKRHSDSICIVSLKRCRVRRSSDRHGPDPISPASTARIVAKFRPRPRIPRWRIQSMVSTITKSVRPLGASGSAVRRMTSSEKPSDRRCRHVLVERLGGAVAVEADGEQQPGVGRVEHPPERHREAALGVALAGLGHERQQRRLQVVVDGARVDDVDAVAVLAQPVVRAPQRLHRPCPAA